MSGPIAEALAGQPGLAARYSAFRTAVQEAFGAERTAMVRQVIAQVHGCPVLDASPLDAEMQSVLVDWRNSAQFSAGERAWLAFAERIPFEHTAIADDEAQG